MSREEILLSVNFVRNCTFIYDLDGRFGTRDRGVTEQIYNVSGVRCQNKRDG